MNLADIGRLVYNRRQALGLSQARLARLSGLSRATINQLETGAIKDLGATKLIALLDLLGVALDAGTKPRHARALHLASQTASVSYKTRLQPAVLAAALTHGDLPAPITPHVATLLDEAPLALIVAAVEEASSSGHLPAKTVWKHVLQWARELGSPREAWA